MDPNMGQYESQQRDEPATRGKDPDMTATTAQRPNPFTPRAFRDNVPAHVAEAFVRRQEALATEKQVAFAKTLIAERDITQLNDKYIARIADICEGKGDPLTKAGASKLIETLMDLPRAAAPIATTTEAPATPDVPAGYYALETGDDATNAVAFYRVDRPETGKWKGYTFVKLLVSDEEVRVSRQQAASVLERIAADPKAASVRYGKETAHCGVCNRRLTNDESRAAGIGPVCAGKF